MAVASSVLAGTADAAVVEQATLTANVSPYDFFGGSVAIDGNVAAVGSYLEGRGKVRIYERAGVTWTLVRTLTRAKGRYFGFSVALDGDALLVGAQHKAHVYVRGATRWTHTAVLSTSTHAFATHVDLDGGTAVLGDPSSQTVAVFAGAGSTWVEEARLEPASVPAGFGQDVAIDGDLIAVGSNLWSAPVPAHVFGRSDGVWSERAQLLPPDAVAGDLYGVEVEVDGMQVLVGAPTRPADGSFAEGAVHVFALSGSDWAQVAVLRLATGGESHFGSSISSEDGQAVIGAPRASAGATLSTEGAAYVFTDRSGQWVQQTRLLPQVREAEDMFGFSVGVDGGTAVVGAPSELEEGPHPGRAVVFTGLTDPS